jgi:hypothetical protein
LSPPRYPSSFRSIWPSSGAFGKTSLVRAHLLPIVVERFRRGAKRRGAQAALPPIANFMARSPITEEASNPNEQASAQIASFAPIRRALERAFLAVQARRRL